MRTPLKSHLLHRYWFPASAGIGVGVTAYSLADAKILADRALIYLPAGTSLSLPVQDISVEELDQLHVIPNMGPCNFHGIWFPQGVI
jgi:hypothetical protein